MTRASNKVLYITYWGATEAIGRGNAVPTVVELARRGFEIFYVTFDKPGDLAKDFVVEEVRVKLQAAGVHWFQLGYHKNPRNLSTVYDLVKGYAFCAALIARHNIKLIHGRTYVGAVIGMMLRRTTSASFLCHPDGQWPDEQVDNGVWNADGKAYRVANSLELKTYKTADETIILSRRSETRVLALAPKTTTTVIHTPVDLDRIPASKRGPWIEDTPFRLVYLGGIGGRYLGPELFRFFAIAQQTQPSLYLRLVTHTDAQWIRNGLSREGFDLSRADIASADAATVGRILRTCDAGVFMLKEGRSNLATSATKVGEYWAAGLPVALTPNCGELDLLAQEHSTGIVIERHDDASYAEAFRRLMKLASGNDIRSRCRAIARRFHSVESIGDAHATIYERLLQNHS